MNIRVKDVIARHRDFLFYVVISVLAALIDYVVGWFFLDTVGAHILLANTFAVFVSAVFHFILTSRLVFHVKTDLPGILVYVITFVVGIVLQNAVIYIFYKYLLSSLDNRLNYLVSKGFSLTLPFLIVFLLRKHLNKKLASSEEKMQ